MAEETEIYSSEGLPPLPPPTHPVPCVNNDNELLTDNLDSLAAFEVFRGKVFPTELSEDASSKIATRAGTSSEPPMQRLLRLKAEVTQLDAEISRSLSLNDTSGMEMQSQTRALLNKIDLLSFKHPKEHVLNRTETAYLVSKIHNEIESYNEKKVLNNSSAATATSSGKGEDGGGVTYELYSSESSGATANEVEKRLLQLEELLGGESNIIQRLEKSEKLIAQLDNASVEQSVARGKILRADLEAASKAKAKLTALMMSKSSTSDDAQIISNLHQQMTQVEGISKELPVIVQRLQQLSSLHSQANTYTSRLTAVEQASNESERMIRSCEETLNRLETGMVENLKLVETNMKALDERIKSLS